MENKPNQKPRNQTTLPLNPTNAIELASKLVSLDAVLKQNLTINEFVEQIELALTYQALDKCKGSVSGAAQILGLQRTTFIMRVRALKAKGVVLMELKD